MAGKKKARPDFTKANTVQELMALVNNEFPGGLMTGRDLLENQAGVIKTGIPSIDRILGGGFICGGITHVFGLPSTSKSSISIRALGNLHQTTSDKFGAVINIEGYWSAKSLPFVKKHGVDVDRLLVVERDKHEVSLQIAEDLIESNKLSLLIVDSISGLVTQEERDKTLTDSKRMGEHATLVRRWLNRILAKSQSKYDPKTRVRTFNETAVIMINQMTGTMNQWNPLTTTGGNAPHYYSDIELQCSIPSIKDNIFYADDKKAFEEMGNTIGAYDFAENNHVGQSITYTCMKNRTAPTKGRSTKVDFYNQDVKVPSSTGFTGFGFDITSDVVNMGLLYGYISETSAGRFQLGEGEDLIKFHGKQNLIDYFRQNLEVATGLLNAVYDEIDTEFDMPEEKDEEDNS